MTEISLLAIIISLVIAVVIGAASAVLAHLITRHKEGNRCRYCSGRGWNTTTEFNGITEFIYNVVCKYCGGTGKRDIFREYAIKNGIDLVGKYKP